MRDLVVFLTAKTVSDVGYALDFICLSVFIWVRTGSTFDTGLVSVVLYGGSIVGGRLGHRYGDRWDRRRMMIGADLVRMSMLVTLAVLPGRAQTWWLYPAVLLIGLGRSVFEASLSAATPVLAGERSQTVNSALAGLKGIAFVIGMGLSAVLVPWIGYRGVFACDAASYGLSATVLLALRARMHLREDSGGARKAAGESERQALWPQLVGAGLAVFVILRGLDAFASSSQQVGLPILGSILRPADPAVVSGVVWSCWAAGLFVAGFLLRPFAKRIIDHSPRRVYCVGMMVMSAGFIGVFWLDNWWLRLVSAFIAGLGDAFSEITFKQAMQTLPDHRRGRAFGLSQMVVNGGFLCGLLVTSLVLHPSLLAHWVLLLHGIPLVAACWAAIVVPRRWRGSGLGAQPAARDGLVADPPGAAEAAALVPEAKP